MLNLNENQNSSPEVLAAQTEGTATEATTAVLDDSTGQETSENDAGNISNDEVMSNNEDDRRVGFSSSTSSSKDLVNEQEGVTESKKGKGKRSASERLKRSKQQLQAKDEEITALKAQQNTQEVTDLKQQLADKEKEIAQLKQQQPNAEVDKLKADLTAKEKEVDKLKKENEELEAKNKTTEQPKQGNGARYTATVGMGLAAGLIAFTALERTVRLDIWVMVGIAVVSTLAVGSITYAALPSTQVNGAEVQGVSGGKTR
ncbi:hypothetical protein [Wolbachia endosymbiont (group A) of Bombylius major]|uniref:hypothetical protein n=1 Tax=Wolbachia endosymbiont (group A) of Bombylius major TaxID=2953988 RepID=UPI00223081B8|nr:hypothetical protein [Wolbachia endosymbiont (group A) of Bombylius major]